MKFEDHHFVSLYKITDSEKQLSVSNKPNSRKDNREMKSQTMLDYLHSTANFKSHLHREIRILKSAELISISQHILNGKEKQRMSACSQLMSDGT